MPRIGLVNGARVPQLVNRGAAGLLHKVDDADVELPPLPESGRADNVRCQGVVLPLDRLRPDPNNCRLHGDRNMHAIKGSLILFGQCSPLTVRADNMMIAAGNGRWRAMKELGWTKAAVSIIPMTDTEFAAYSLADNRTAELASWNLETMKRMEALVSGGGGHMLGWTDEEIMALRRRGERASNPDVAYPKPSEPVSRPGDLWLLGRHRLLCGDATDGADVARLLGGRRPGLCVTDPPYGVDYDPIWRGQMAGRPTNALGLVTGDMVMDWTPAFRLVPSQVIYCWHACWFTGEVAGHLRDCGFVIRYQIIWGKTRINFGRGHYHWQHEPCWYAVRPGGTARWCGGRKESTLWTVAPNLRSETGHCAQKPVECMARPIANHDFAEVYDPFVGSGTTLIAAEQAGRRCFAMDLDPGYVDVCVERWQEFTGQKAKRKPPA
jgi:DNA modification methylase